MYHCMNSVCAPKTQPQTHQQAAYPQTKVAYNVEVKQESSSSSWQQNGTMVSLSEESRSLHLTYSAQLDSSPELSAPIAEAEAVTEPPQRNSYSSTILSAIEAQLMRDQADGASQEELESRLAAGLEGFLEGYKDAFAQLEALAEFTPEVRSQVEETYQQVLQGIDELAEELGVESPVDSSMLKDNDAQPAAMATETVSEPQVAVQSYSQESLRSSVRQQIGSRVLNSAAQDIALIESIRSQKEQGHTYDNSVSANQRAAYQVSEQRSLDFSLTTDDGDVVNISFTADKSGSAAWDAGNGELLQLGEQNSSFDFVVEGDLDAEELNAIHELLVQVGDISESFFSGEMANAVTLAQAIQYDDSEINTFDIYMGHSVSESGFVESSSTEEPVPADKPLPDSFVEQVDYASQLAQGLNKPASLVADLTEWVAQNTHPRDPWSQQVGAFMRSIV